MGNRYGENAIDYDLGHDGSVVLQEKNEASGIYREYTEVIVKVANFDTAPVVANHVAECPITRKLAGMKLVDVRTITHTPGAGDPTAATLVMIHQVRSGVSQDIMDTPISHGNEIVCHDGAVDETYEVTQEGDLHAVDIDAVRTGMLGFWVVFCYKPVDYVP